MGSTPDFPPPDFQALFEAAPGLYLVLTPALQIVTASDAYLRATMTTRGEILGRAIFDVFPDNPDDPSATGVRNLMASLERVRQTRRPDAMAVQKYDIRRPAAQGGGFEERYWSPFNSPVLDSNGELAYIIHRVDDVTDFIRVKQAGKTPDTLALPGRLEEMEAEIYRRAQQVAEANRQLTSMNEALAKLYREIAILMAKSGAELGGEAGDAQRPEPPALIAPENMLARISELIAAQRRLEEQLRHAQKMEAVGRLAGGVAHDFNNFLTVITGYASLLRDVQEGSDAAAALEEIEKAVARAASLTHKLLAFSRKQILQPRIFTLNSVVGGMEDLLRRLIGEHILLVTNLDDHLGSIKADPNQIEQVIMNLAVNARDAMPKGGRLIIETRRVQLERGFRSLHPGPYALLTVTDTGHGMDAATAARIFEPFFTTKELGKGTGLGLSTVYGIIEQSGGLVEAESAPGAGAVFRIYLPISEDRDERQPAEPASARQTGRTGTILLVEDEAPLRKLISNVLSAAGYRVLEAGNGQDALALAISGQAIDLLLTDVVMPGMTGPDVVTHLKESLSGLPVLYMSGYDCDLIDRTTLELTAGFLPKPFTPRTLLNKVAELLWSKRSGDISRPAGS